MPIITPKVPASSGRPLDADIVHSVPVHVFVATLKETMDEIYGHLLLWEHKRESHTPMEWQKILNSYRTKPVSYRR